MHSGLPAAGQLKLFTFIVHVRLLFQLWLPMCFEVLDIHLWKSYNYSPQTQWTLVNINQLDSVNVHQCSLRLWRIIANYSFCKWLFSNWVWTWGAFFTSHLLNSPGNRIILSFRKAKKIKRRYPLLINTVPAPYFFCTSCLYWSL